MIYKLMEKIDNKVIRNDTGAYQFSDTVPDRTHSGSICSRFLEPTFCP